MNYLTVYMTWALLCAAADPVPSEEVSWATVTGRFVISSNGMKDEQSGDAQVSPGVLAAGSGFVWLETTRERKPIPIHPAYEMTSQPLATLQMTRGSWLPRLATTRTGKALVVQTRDEDGSRHAISFRTVKNANTGQVYSRDGSYHFIFRHQEPVPIPFEDPVTHKGGYLLIRDSPYMASCDSTGRFTMRRVPAGEWNLVLWIEKIGWLKRAQINEQPVEFPRGRMSIRIDRKTLDIGNVHYEDRDSRKATRRESSR